MTTKQIVIAFAVLVLIAFIVGLAKESKPVVTIPETPATATPTNLCFYRSDKTASGFYDRGWMRINVDGANVTGEFSNLPAEKDSKIGTFTGTVSPVDIVTGKQIATLIWDSQAEGMQNKEELLVKFGSGNAQAAFGEMVLGANGVYVYKNKSAAVYQQALPQIDCALLDEITAVEAYIRSSDIATITKDAPVLGGTMFVTSVVVDTKVHTALTSYEDGHIAGKGTLAYTFDPTSKKVTVTGFTKAK